jgi:hypothetical protein
MTACLDPDHRFSGMPLMLAYCDGRTWMLRRSVAYRLADGRTATVRAPFAFDFASIPRMFWRVVGPPTGAGPGANYGIAAVWHDWLYRHKAIGGRPITRATADAVLLEIMRYTRVDAWRAWVIYWAVRAFGWAAWRGQ